MKNKNNGDIKHLVLNSGEPAYTVHIKDITYVNEAFDGPTELIIDVEKAFIEQVVVEDAACLSQTDEVRKSTIEDVIYEDILENYNEEVVDFTIISVL